MRAGLTLEGTVEWRYQKKRAAEAVRNVRRIRFVTNDLAVKAQAMPLEIRQKIEDASRRSARIDAAQITSDPRDDARIDSQNGDRYEMAGPVARWRFRARPRAVG